MSPTPDPALARRLAELCPALREPCVPEGSLLAFSVAPEWHKAYPETNCMCLGLGWLPAVSDLSRLLVAAAEAGLGYGDWERWGARWAVIMADADGEPGYREQYRGTGATPLEAAQRAFLAALEARAVKPEVYACKDCGEISDGETNCRECGGKIRLRE